MEAHLMLVMVKFMVEYQIIFKALQFIILIFAESNHLYLVWAPQPKETTLSPISASEGRGGEEDADGWDRCFAAIRPVIISFGGQ